LEIVRKNHNEASAKIIIESITPGSGISLGLEGCKELANYVASVCRYHRSLDLEELKDRSVSGKDVKLPLLAALLRLGDELDADYRRVNLDVLNMRNIPPESKYHWWAHHYVQSVSIKNGTVELYFRFLEEYKNSDIIKALRQKVVESVRKQYFEVYDILDGYGIRLYRDVKIADEEYLPASLEPVPSDLLEYINENVIKLKERSEGLSRKTGVTFYLDGVLYSDYVKIVKCISRLIELIGEEKIRDAIRLIERCSTLTMGPKERMTFTLAAGKCYYIQRDLIGAKTYFDESLKISDREDLQTIYKTETLISKANAFNNIGLIYLDKGDLDQAIKSHQKALKINKKVGDKQVEACNFGNIGLIYREKGDLDQSIKYHRKALKIDKEIKDRQGVAINLGNIGLIYFLKGDINRSLKYLEEALKIGKEIGYRKGQADQLIGIGLIYQHKGELDKALEYYQKALKIVEEIGYRHGEAVVLGNIGLIHQDRGELDEALKYHKKAMKIDKELGFRHSEAIELGNIGLIYKDKGELDEALKYHKKAMKIDKELGYRQSEATQLGNIGLIYYAKGNTSESLRYHKEALNINKEIGYEKGYADHMGNIGIIYHNEGDYDQALKYYQEVLIIEKRLGYRQGEANALGNIGLIYIDNGNLDQALKFLKKALVILDRYNLAHGRETVVNAIMRLETKDSSES